MVTLDMIAEYTQKAKKQDYSTSYLDCIQTYKIILYAKYKNFNIKYCDFLLIEKK